MKIQYFLWNEDCFYKILHYNTPLINIIIIVVVDDDVAVVTVSYY